MSPFCPFLMWINCHLYDCPELSFIFLLCAILLFPGSQVFPILGFLFVGLETLLFKHSTLNFPDTVSDYGSSLIHCAR